VHPSGQPGEGVPGLQGEDSAFACVPGAVPARKGPAAPGVLLAGV